MIRLWRRRIPVSMATWLTVLALVPMPSPATAAAKPARVIQVEGDAQVEHVPDLAVVRMAVRLEGPDVEPLRAEVARRVDALLQLARRFSIAADDIEAADLSVRPDYEWRPQRRLRGFVVERTVQLRVRDLGRLGELLDQALAAGASEIRGVDMQLADRRAAEDAALELALGRARAKAERLAVAAGGRLGRVLEIEESGDAGARPVMMRMAEVADAANTIEPGVVVIGARVRVLFALD